MKPLAQNSLIQNRYLIVHLIGKGGMGEVYLAVDQRLGSAVALKRTYFAGDEMLGNAFEREARTLARMRHPVLPKVSDHFGEGDEQYLVMEHISGDDLSKRLETSQKPFPISWVLFWADQLLDALSYLHSHEPPIIHRDIKPQNLKLTDENNIILLDFGLSKTSTGMTNISQSGSTGSVVGYTPHYAPMEQIRGIGTSARSDLYSLSATLYQLLTGTVPPDALSRADAMLNGSPDPVIPLHELNPEVSKTVSEVIHKGMEVSQEKRFADAREMQKILRRAFTEMQEAMSAKTVAFSGLVETVVPKTVEDVESSAVKAGDLSVPRTVVDLPAPEMPAGVPADVDFDATIAIDEVIPEPNQPGVHYPVRTQGNASIPANDEQVTVERIRAFPPTPYNSESGSEFGNGSVPEPGIESATPVPVNAASGPSSKSSGRMSMVFGGLVALIVLGALAGGGGWFVYSNYYADTTAIDPAPSPEPTLVATPSPEPTIAAIVEANSNSSPEQTLESNQEVSNTESAPPRSPEQPASDVGIRAQQAAPAARNPNQRPVPATVPKTTPKPKAPSDRTRILQ